MWKTCLMYGCKAVFHGCLIRTGAVNSLNQTFAWLLTGAFRLRNAFVDKTVLIYRCLDWI